MTHLIKNIKPRSIGVFLCVIFCHVLITSAKPQMQVQRSTIIDAYNDILKLKIDNGRSILEKITPTTTSIGHYYYVKNLADVLELLLKENPAKYKRYNDNEDKYLKALKEMDDSDPYKLFYEAEIKLQWAMVKVQYGDELRAGIALRSAWNTIQKNKNSFPEFSTNYKTLGLLHLIFGSMPDGYQWILRVLGIKGDITMGLRALDLISQLSPSYLESRIIKLVASINVLGQNDRTIYDIGQLLEEHKDNLLLNYIYCTSLVKYAKSDEALERLKRIEFLSSDYMFINLIYYQLGEIYLQKQNYSTSRDYYSKFLNSHEGRNFVKDAWFKTALTHWLEGDEKLAEVHFDKADDSGKTFVSPDKNANGILNEDKRPDRDLMKVRLATDGGYYEIADQILSRLNEDMFESKKDKTKYYYRQARLKHKQDDTEKAIYFYLFSIKKAGNENWYYAPNASLNTGYIYLNRGNTEKARFYFEKALSYKKHKYKSEIDVKAKAALASLGQIEKRKKKKDKSNS